MKFQDVVKRLTAKWLHPDFTTSKNLGMFEKSPAMSCRA